MSERQSFTLYEPAQAHRALMSAWAGIKSALMAGHRMVLEIKLEKRSSPQNRRMWAMLRDISQQVDWYGQKLTDEEWKHVFTASLSKQKVVPGIDGGFVVLGKSTSRMTKPEMAELQELMAAFGAEHGVVFRDPVDMQWAEAA